MESNLMKNLKMTPVTEDAAMYVKHQDDRTADTRGSYVHKLLNAGPEEIHQLTDKRL